MLRKIYKRIYDDFFRESRLPLYDKMLKNAIDNGYQFYTIESFNKLIVQKKLDDSIKYAIIRHDIDTDPLTAYELFKIEKKYNIKSTYYFRLSTIDKKLLLKYQILVQKYLIIMKKLHHMQKNIDLDQEKVLKNIWMS